MTDAEGHVKGAEQAWATLSGGSGGGGSGNSGGAKRSQAPGGDGTNKRRRRAWASLGSRPTPRQPSSPRPHRAAPL